MPQFPHNSHGDAIRDRSQSPGQPYSGKPNMWGRAWHTVGNLWKKEDEDEEEEHEQTATDATRQINEKIAEGRSDGNGKSRTEVTPSLPRAITFRRQDSERRDRLIPHEPDAQERRACSTDRRRANSVLREPSTATIPIRPSSSLPEPRILRVPSISANRSMEGFKSKPDLRINTKLQNQFQPPFESPEERCPGVPSQGAMSDRDNFSDEFEDHHLRLEIESKWILNLSMHFRDKSDREKFFITYAKEPNKWLRVTVSLDYREIQEDSLEYDLKGLHYQRDKSARIYEAIRDSLSGIQFYPTVTNLKLQTREGRLHVHVTEDVNEIIKYPSLSLVRHVEDAPRVKESEIEIDSHLSGFVYKIRTSLKADSPKKIYIKKEIPGPDSVEEFLYEINSLSKLRGSPHIIEFKGIVTDNEGQLIKGLLIAYAEGGTLIDLLYDHRHDTPLHNSRSPAFLSLSSRLGYAWQILRGLKTIHAYGFVQGDFTLSNIVLDAEGNARIIDINRRGCPVGWEPPELDDIIQSNGRVGMFIGVKSDVWQCGMVLWALGRGLDEPERADGIGDWDDFDAQVEPDEVPDWYKAIVKAALQREPQHRKTAAELLDLWPSDWENSFAVSGTTASAPPGVITPPGRSEEQEYIDPDLAVSREDIAMKRGTRSPAGRSRSHRSGFTASDLTFAEEAPTSTEYIFESSGSYVVGNRGAGGAEKGESAVDAKDRSAAQQPLHEEDKDDEKDMEPENDKNGGERYDRRSAEEMRLHRISTGVPASLLTQKLRALEHTDSGFDEPRETPTD